MGHFGHPEYSSASNPKLQRPEAERSVLGALIIDPARVPEVAAICGPEDFCTREHEAVMQALISLSCAIRDL